MMTERHLESPVRILERRAEPISNTMPFCIEQLKKRLSEAETTEEIAEIRLTTSPEVLIQTFYLFDEALERVLCQIMLSGNLDHSTLYDIFENAPKNTQKQRAIIMSCERLEKICLEKILTARTFNDIYQIHLICPPAHYCKRARHQIDRAVFKIGVARVGQLSAMELHLLSRFYEHDNYFSKKIRKAISSSFVIRERFYEELSQAISLDDYAKLYEQYRHCGSYFDEVINSRIYDYCLIELAKDSSKDNVWELYLKCPYGRSARDYIIRNFLI